MGYKEIQKKLEEFDEKLNNAVNKVADSVNTGVGSVDTGINKAMNKFTDYTYSKEEEIKEEKPIITDEDLKKESLENKSVPKVNLVKDDTIVTSNIIRPSVPNDLKDDGVVEASNIIRVAEPNSGVEDVVADSIIRPTVEE